MRRLCAALLAVLFASSAAAQTRGFFFQAGPLLDGLATATAESLTTRSLIQTGVTYRWNDINGDRRWQPGEEEAIVPGTTTLETRTSSEARFAPGASIGVGAFVTPSLSLRVEGSFHGGRTTTTETTPRTLGAPVATRHEVAITDLLVSAGWHRGESRKVTLTYLAGMVFRRQREVTTSTFNFFQTSSLVGLTPLSEINLTDEDRSTRYRAGVIAGLDAAVNLSRSVAIVPQLRMVAANGDWSIRPAVAMRWRP